MADGEYFAAVARACGFPVGLANVVAALSDAGVDVGGVDVPPLLSLVRYAERGGEIVFDDHNAPRDVLALLYGGAGVLQNLRRTEEGARVARALALWALRDACPSQNARLAIESEHKRTPLPRAAWEEARRAFGEDGDRTLSGAVHTAWLLRHARMLHEAGASDALSSI